jgi:hypothetical protein
MSTNHDTRTLGLQLPLPLLDAEPAPAPCPVAVPDPAPEPGGGDGEDDGSTDSNWRLDEHTRQVGRRGIAEARARLRTGSGRAA